MTQDRASDETPPLNPQAMPQLRRRDAILGAVARCVELTAGLQPPAEFADEVLAILGAATGVSRVYVFELRRGPMGQTLACQRYEWAAPGIAPQIENQELQAVLMDVDYARWLTLLRRGDPVVGDIADFPASERPTLEMQQILSLLVQPIFVGARLWGMIGFDSCERTQSWDRVEVDVLRIAAHSFGAAIQRQEREAQMARMQRMEAMGRMAGSVAHDFNNVLTVLAGAFDAVEQDLGQRGDQAMPKDLAAVFRQALDQGQGLTRRLLEFSRERQARPTDVDLGAIVTRCVPLLQQALGGRIRLQASCQPDLPPVRIDPVQVEQILLNLAVNARDAMPQGGAVVLEVAIAADPHLGPDAALGSGRAFVQLLVADTGKGIPTEALERLFEPFFTTKGEQGGTGLGLSTVDAIVAAAGGKVTAANRPRGGAEFRILLPAASTSERA